MKHVFDDGTLVKISDGVEFTVKDDKIIEGLDRAVMTMKKGEVALLTIPYRYAFGSLDTPQEMAVVPPYSTLYNQ
ncbi:FKBP-type peptidyl-prolyl cis-trans isomerase [Medicago truncatula]|uniref:peptidylprolyl isomerase n=1 Tax=Medicago truncatula TaxID=3880 RepID=G7LF62_MEDTR|nr:FKBP-type peptidyl-prolyl cis-trans isomerase [Medicago truncatula]